jgi:hypothetical protein
LAAAPRLSGRRRAPPAATLGFLVLSIFAGAVPGLPAALGYDRSGTLSGDAWRPLRGQIVRWSAAMAITDLGVIALAGGWLEMRSRGLAAAAAAAAALLVAAALLAARPDVERYRGASGIGVALVAAGAADLALGGRPAGARIAGAACLALLLAKAAAEAVTGGSILPWTLPAGIDLVPEAHLAGAAAGAGAALVHAARTRRGPPRRIAAPRPL